MSENLLLAIFLIVWLGIASYLFSIDRKIRQLKERLPGNDEPSN